LLALLKPPNPSGRSASKETRSCAAPPILWAWTIGS